MRKHYQKSTMKNQNKSFQCLLFTFIALCCSINNVLSQQTFELYEQTNQSNTVKAQDILSDSQRNYETVRLNLTQAFFDNFQENLVIPLINKLSGFQISDKSLSLNIIDVMMFDANLTNITVSKSQIVQEGRIVELKENGINFDLQNFSIYLTYDYEYITDPPYLVDIGDQLIAFDQLKVYFESETIVDKQSGDFYFNLTTLQLSEDSHQFVIDGVSDFSIIINNLINGVIDLVSSKIQYLIGSALSDKLVPLINKLVLSIPSDIKIPGTNLRLDLFFASEPLSTANYSGYLTLPVSLSIQSEDFPFTHVDPVLIQNDDNLLKHQVELFITEYMIDNVLFLVHKEQLINVGGTQESLTVGLLSVTLGNNFDGYNTSSQCSLTITTLDPYPTITLNLTDSKINANLSVEIKCQRQPNDTEYEHIANLIADLQLVYNLVANESNMTIQFIEKKTTLNIPGYYNSTVGEFASYRLYLMATFVQSLLDSVIKQIFKDGIKVNDILEYVLKSDIVTLSQFDLVNFNGYMALKITPVFNVTDKTVSTYNKLFLDYSSNAQSLTPNQDTFSNGLLQSIKSLMTSRFYHEITLPKNFNLLNEIQELALTHNELQQIKPEDFIAREQFISSKYEKIKQQFQ
eukprot:403342396